MPLDSLHDLIAAVRARGEPINFESLLNWPAPTSDFESFQAAQATLDAFNEAQRELDRKHGVPWRSDPVEKKRIRKEIETLMEEDEKLRVKYENMTHEDVDRKLKALAEELTAEQERRKDDPFWKQFVREPVPKTPFLDDKPEIDVELSPEDWRIIADHLARFQTMLDKALTIPTHIDWRPGINPESYFDDASEYHEAIYPARLLCLTAIRHALQLRQNDWDKYLTSAAHLGAGASSIRLLMSHLVQLGCVQRILDTITYILHHAAASPETLCRLAATAASLDDENMLERVYAGERVFGLAQYRDKLPETERTGDWWNRLKREKALDAQYYLTDLARLIDIARLPLKDRYSSWLALMQEPFEPPKAKDNHGWVRPALLNDLIFLTRLRLMKAVLTVLCNGPEVIESDNSFLQDPFDREGRSLRYRRLTDGFVLYSVGLDQIDGGGSIEAIDDLGPLQDFVPRRRFTKDFSLEITPRQDGRVSLVWS